MKTFRIIHHVDQDTIKKMYHDYSPVFILSTGRSGSKFIAGVLNQSAQIAAFHEPCPTLMYFSNYAFHNQEKTDTLSKIIETARMESVLEIFIQGKTYVESNQCLTFFAPVLKNLFRNAKFVHLVRHPGDFVRSAIRKGWHQNDSIWESGRIRMENQAEWDRMSQIKKLAWVWQTTGSFIDTFGLEIEKERFFTVQFEQIVENTAALKELLAFIGVPAISDRQIKKWQKTRINPFRISGMEPPNIKKKDFPRYELWKDSDKNDLKKYCRPLAEKFGYQL